MGTKLRIRGTGEKRQVDGSRNIRGPALASAYVFGLCYFDDGCYWSLGY